MGRLFPLTLAMILVGCPKADTKDTKSPASAEESGPKVDVTVQAATYGDQAQVSAEVVKRCKFDKKVAKAVTENAPGAKLGSSGGKVLELTVVSMRGLDPTYQGERHVTLEGRLTNDSIEVSRFKARRSTMGGLFGGVRGICRDLDVIADSLGEDIGAWLLDPQGNRLGDL